MSDIRITRGCGLGRRRPSATRRRRRAVLAALPITGRASTWGDEIYFSIPVDADESRPPRPSSRSATSPTGRPGRPSASSSARRRPPAATRSAPPAPVNVVGRMEGDATVLRQVRDGHLGPRGARRRWRTSRARRLPSGSHVSQSKARRPCRHRRGRPWRRWRRAASWRPAHRMRPRRACSACSFSSAFSRTAAARRCGMTTTPSQSARMTSPGSTATPPQEMGRSCPTTVALAEKFTGLTLAAKMGMPISSMGSMSRTAPSMTAPSAPRTCRRGHDQVTHAGDGRVAAVADDEDAARPAGVDGIEEVVEGGLSRRRHDEHGHGAPGNASPGDGLDGRTIAVRSPNS